MIPSLDKLPYGMVIREWVYDADKMIKVFKDRDGMTEDEAHEYILFNIENSYIGEDTPVLVWPQDEWDGEYD